MMFVMLIAFLVAAFAILCLRVPSVWSALMAIDDLSDARELGLVVATRKSHTVFYTPLAAHLALKTTLIRCLTHHREPFP